MIVAACGGQSSHTSPAQREAAVYLNRALGDIQKRSVFARRIDFGRVRRRAVAIAREAKTPAGTYDAIRFALAQLRDGHARLFTSSEASKLDSSVASAATAVITPTVESLNGDGWIRLPPILALPDTRAAARYEEAASTIASLKRRGTCRWIVDLRSNTGGDMYPMLLAIRPLLTDGDLLGFRSVTGQMASAVLRGDTIEIGNHQQARATPLGEPIPRPAEVAVLTDGRTASSGEAVAITFRGRPNARSFGTPTAGAPTSPSYSRLSDGALLRVANLEDVDVTGRAYDGPIVPDTPVTEAGDGDAVITAAESWLATTAACS
jgi:hypothetical protein